MFQGFNKDTVAFLEAIQKENSKVMYKEKEKLYYSGIKEPLEQIYYELSAYLTKLDVQLAGDKRRCISSAYNDARFNKENPIKEYFYVKFKLPASDKKNALGFFLDASLEGYRYGLNIYNLDAKGMAKIRDNMLDNKNSSTATIKKFEKTGLLTTYGELYKKPFYTEENEYLQMWLNHKTISFMHINELDEAFFTREVLENMLTAFDSVQEVYLMLKEGLK